MAFKLKRVESLFPIPLIIGEIEGAATLNPELLAEIAERRRQEPGIKRSNRHGWHSELDLFERPEPAHRQLAAALTEMIVDATKQMVPGANFDQLETNCAGWINVNPSGGYNGPHDHPGAFWSGSYYVSMPTNGDDDPGGGAIEFLSHSPSSIYATMLPAPMTSDKMRINPSAGIALLFPATLRHWVVPHHADAERVTVAFNARFLQRRAS